MKIKNYYINNDEFYKALKSLYDSGQPLNEHEQGDYIGNCIMQICKNLAFSNNFIGYTYREELIEDAIENCIKYIHAFNPYKSKYAFTYFSKVAYYAFLRRLKKEKEQQYVKYKMLSDSIQLREYIEASSQGEVYDDPSTNAIVNQVQQMMFDSDKFTETFKNEKRSLQQKQRETFVEEHENSVGRFI